MKYYFDRGICAAFFLNVSADKWEAGLYYACTATPLSRWVEGSIDVFHTEDCFIRNCIRTYIDEHHRNTYNHRLSFARAANWEPPDPRLKPSPPCYLRVADGGDVCLHCDRPQRLHSTDSAGDSSSECHWACPEGHGKCRYWWLRANDEIIIKSFAPEGTLLKVADYATGRVLCNWAGELVGPAGKERGIPGSWRWIRLPVLDKSFGGTQ